MFELEIIAEDLQKERIREADAHRLIQEMRDATPKPQPSSYRVLVEIGRWISAFGNALQYKFSAAESSKSA